MIRDSIANNVIKNYKTVEALKGHVRTKHDVKKHFCCFCQKGFENQQYLNVHVKTLHQEKQSFQCDFCPKTFTLRGNMTTHRKKSHLGIRHNCEFCSKTFTTKAYLTKHKKMVCKENVIST